MPRILTNNNNLPLPLYLAIKNDTYEARGDISTTTLIDAPYIRLLRKYNTYTEDASENIWSLHGQAMHAVVERIGSNFERTKFMPEEKLMIRTSGIEFKREVDVSGTSDLIEIDENNRVILHDFKNIFVWTAKQGTSSSSYEKWTKQLNIYRYMIKECLNLEVEEIKVHAFIRDWNLGKSERTADYPPYPAMTFDIKPYSHASILGYIKKRIDLHFLAEENFKSGRDNMVDVCEPEDRWARPTVWRLVKLGNKRALKNITIRDDADELNAKATYAELAKKNSTLTIDVVKGGDTRCESFCPVNMFCKYYQKEYVEKESEKREEGGENQSGTGRDIQETDSFGELKLEF